MPVQRVRDAIWRKRLRAVGSVWAAASRGDAEGIHQFRVASRRIREALPIVADGRHLRRIQRMRRRMRALRRTLGPIRDRDVSLSLLASLEEAHPEHRSAIALVRASLQAERDELRRQLERQLEEEDPDGLVRKLARAVRVKPRAGGQVAAADEDGTGARWQLALATRVVRRARELERALDHAGALYARDRLHGVRVAVKKLRYALELGQETRAFRWGTAVRSLKTLQDGLGQLQDHEALLDRIREIQTPLGRTPTLTALDRLARFVEETTRQFHAGFLTRQGRLRALCAAVRRQASQAIPAGRPLAPRLTEGPSVARRERR